MNKFGATVTAVSPISVVCRRATDRGNHRGDAGDKGVNQSETRETIDSYLPLVTSHTRAAAAGGRCGMSGLDANWGRLAPNGTNLGLFKIIFSTFWLADRI